MLMRHYEFLSYRAALRLQVGLLIIQEVEYR